MEILKPYLFLTHLRLRWYVRASGQLLLQHWQWIAVISLLVPGLPMAALVAILELPSKILIAAVSRQHGIVWHLTSLLALQAAALIWIMPQRDNVKGGDFARYAATLPIPGIARRCADITVLFVADGLILVAGILAMTNRLALQTADGAYQTVALAVLASNLALFQLVALNRQWLRLIAIATTDLALCLSITLRTFDWMLLFLAFASTFAAAFIPLRAPEIPVRRRRQFGAIKRHTLRPYHGPTAALAIQWKILATRPLFTAARLSLALGLALGANRLIALFAFDERALPTIILALAAIALTLSGAYRGLRDAHAPMRTYMAALPVASFYWPLRDTVCIVLLGIAPLVILLLTAQLHGLVSLLGLMSLAITYLLLLAMLRLPLVLSRRLSVMFGFLLAAGWAGAAMAAVAR
ncbi:MAG: hypothetical protein ACYC5H_02275 [Methylovirgula sp.]